MCSLAPAMCSLTPALCSPAPAIHKLACQLRGAGAQVLEQTWAESEHVGHLRCHPADYRTITRHFVEELVLGGWQALHPGVESGAGVRVGEDGRRGADLGPDPELEEGEDEGEGEGGGPGVGAVAGAAALGAAAFGVATMLMRSRL